MMKQFFTTFVQSIFKHNLGLLAAVIAFFGFSSLLPILALLVYAASFIVPEQTVARFLQNILDSYLPMLPASGTFTAGTISHLKTYEAGVTLVGLGGLLWGAVGGFVTLQQVLDTVYDVKRRRSFFRQYVVGFTMMGILLGLTLVSSIFAGLSPQFLANMMGLSNIAIVYLMHDVSRIAFPLILLATCYSCYRILPSRRLPVLPLILGAFVSTGLIYLSRALFAIYTHHLGNYELLYGALTFIMLLTFWIYIVCMILLLGAEVAVTTSNVWNKKEQGS